MDPSSQFVVPTIIDVPELIVTNDDIDYEDSIGGGFWLNKAQFLASASSYTIGLANLWRFPYLCHKHAGGAFLVAYTSILITVGLPLFLMELAFGQYANEGPITIWRISPAFEGIGYTMCLISVMVAIYYTILNTWLIQYLFGSLTLAWSTCDNSWNTNRCFLKPDNLTLISGNSQGDINGGESIVIGSNCSSLVNSNISTNPALIDPELMSVSTNNTSNLLGPCSTSPISSSSSSMPPPSFNSFDKILNTSIEVTLPANEYFHLGVLGITSSINELGGLNQSLVFSLILILLIQFTVILRNLRPPPLISLITLIMSYLTLIALFVRAITLPSSSRGIWYYFTPEWSRLQNIDIWADATSQIFFSLSPCWGGIITLANMNKFHNNFHANSMLIVCINYLTSIFAGLVTFAILGYMSGYSGIAIFEPSGNVTDAGLGFAFMVYTEGLAQLPLAGINSFIFFAIVLMLGLNNQLTVIETVITTIVDTWPHKLRYRRPLVLMILCGLMFIVGFTMCFGNGFYMMQLLDSFAGTFTGMIVGILELIAIAWVYGMENFMQDIDDMISFHRSLFPSRSYWYFMWRYLSPSVLFAILLFCFTDLPPMEYRGIQFPGWTMTFGWTLTLVCVSIIPLMAFIRYLLSPAGSIGDKISYLCRPSEDWAPSSYVSGPKLINRHQMLDDSDLMDQRCTSIYTSHRMTPSSYDDQDQESNESNEDLKVVDGKANYIIPEEEDDTDTGLITNETNV